MTARLAELLARTLDADERAAVLGDVAESGASPLRDVFGLVARRQVAMWKHPRPWVALIGLVVPFGLWLGWATQGPNPIQASLQYGIGWRAILAIVVRGFLAMTCFSWALGLLIGTLSRGAAWVNSLLLSMTLMASVIIPNPAHGLFRRIDSAFDLIYWLLLQIFAVLLPSIAGMLESFRLSARPATRTILLTLGMASAAILALSGIAVLRLPTGHVPQSHWLARYALMMTIVDLWPVAYWTAKAIHKRAAVRG